MADNKESARKDSKAPKPKAERKQDKKKKTESDFMSDPALAKYHGLLAQEEDKKTLEQSMLISLIIIFVALYITWPSFEGKDISKEVTEERVEVREQKIIKPPEKKEEKREVKRQVEERQREFNQIPDLSRPTGETEIIEDVRVDKIDVNVEDVSDLDFGLGGLPDQSPGPKEIAGDIIKPEVSFSGPQPFPQKAKILRRSGQVTVRLIVRKDGSYEVLEVINENPAGFGFGDAMLEYLKQSSWKPAMQNGRPIDVYYNLTLNFQLQ